MGGQIARMISNFEATYIGYRGSDSPDIPSWEHGLGAGQPSRCGTGSGAKQSQKTKKGEPSARPFFPFCCMGSKASHARLTSDEGNHVVSAIALAVGIEVGNRPGRAIAIADEVGQG